MDPLEFVKTLYCGDRVCKKIILNGWDDQIAIQLNLISRIRDPSGEWRFNTEEDIPDGLIVLSQITSFSIDPPGVIPNDEVLGIDVEPIEVRSRDPMYLFTFHIGYAGKTGDDYQHVKVGVIAARVHLEDPSRPGVCIAS